MFQEENFKFIEECIVSQLTAAERAAEQGISMATNMVTDYSRVRDLFHDKKYDEMTSFDWVLVLSSVMFGKERIEIIHDKMIEQIDGIVKTIDEILKKDEKNT